jgi:hypothetical protein
LKRKKRRLNMKKLFAYSAMMALCSPVVFAAQQTWTGQISDAMCKSDHAMMQKGAMKMSDKECAMACAKAGQKYVLVSNGKVYQIENQTAAGLAANAGGTVKVTGEANADGSSLKIAQMEAVLKK